MMERNKLYLTNTTTGFVYTLEEIKQKVEPVFEKYDIKRAYVFGSYARGEAMPNSDVDIMIHAPENFSLINLEEFCEELVTVLEKKVDVITEETYTRDIQYLEEDSPLYKAKKEFFDRVKKERKLIYD